MYHIRKLEITDDAKIERTEPAVSYDKVTYEDAIKLMYRKPDGSIKRYWVGTKVDNNLDFAAQVFIMNNNGKTLEILGS